ncbi:MAG TPA: DUF4912 domain-containing protein [Clostridiaceae bacterium]|nr:DUF4912 domain-containing protein [Clostridiaceae bacterium]
MKHNEFDNEYRLPQSYNDNSITLVAQSPHLLYAYWEISEDKKRQFIECFGQELWNASIPVLKVFNITKNKVLFTRTNEFSNSLYMEVPDSNCSYIAEIGRKISDKFFISLAHSNCVNTPSDTLSNNTVAIFTDYKRLKTEKEIPNVQKLYKKIELSLNSDLSGMTSPFHK